MARIYQAATMGEANVRVAIVDSRGEADLLAFRVSSWGMAVGDRFWFVTRSRQDATASVFFTSPGFADLKVCFVGSRNEAGWQRPNRFQGKLG